LHFNPLNAELNAICHLLALSGAHHFLHVSRIRVKIINQLLVSHPAPPQVADRGKLTRYGGYRGNKIPGVDQN